MRPETRDHHGCSACGRRFVVVYYQLDADEPRRPAPVACPHCGAINRLPISSSAAQAHEYWTEKQA